MKRTAFDENRDQRVAEEAGADQRLMCCAHGCPNRWSVDIGKRMCSAHYAADPIEWPAVTQQQIDAQTDRAYRAQFPRPARSPRR